MWHLHTVDAETFYGAALLSIQYILWYWPDLIWLKLLNSICSPAVYFNTLHFFTLANFKKSFSPSGDFFFFLHTSRRPITGWAHTPIIVVRSRINSREDVGGRARVQSHHFTQVEQPKPSNHSGHVCNLIHRIPLLPPPFMSLGHPLLHSPLPSYFILQLIPFPFCSP